MDNKGQSLVRLEPAATRERLERNTLWVALGLTLAALAWGGMHVAVSVGIGGALGILNLRWVSASLGAMLEGAAAEGGRIRPTAWKFILRWLFLGGIAMVAWWTGWLDLIGIVVGFCAFLGAAFLEAIYSFVLSHGHGEI